MDNNGTVLMEEPKAQERNLDLETILRVARERVAEDKLPEPEKAEKPEEKPAAKRPAEKSQPAASQPEDVQTAASQPEDVQLPGWLLSRASQYGMTQDEAKEWKTQDALNRHLDGLDRSFSRYQQYRQQQQQQQQAPQPDPAALVEDDFWKDGIDVKNEDGTTRKVMRGDIDDSGVAMIDKVRNHYQQKLSKMEQTMEAVLAHLNQQAQAQSRSEFDKLLDGIEGYEDVLGKGSVGPDSKHWESRAKLEQVLQAEAELYGKFGGQFDLREAAQNAVKRLWGTRESREVKDSPRNDRGQFTATHKPTARAEAEKEHGVDRAVDWIRNARARWGRDGAAGADIHGED